MARLKVVDSYLEVLSDLKLHRRGMMSSVTDILSLLTAFKKAWFSEEAARNALLARLAQAIALAFSRSHITSTVRPKLNNLEGHTVITTGSVNHCSMRHTYVRDLYHPLL